jgi:hypothetical protein
MSEPIQELEKAEQVWQRVVDSLNTAAQGVEEAVALVNNLFSSHKPHSALEAAIKAIEGNVAKATHAHNEVLAQIRAAKSDADYTASEAG